MAYADKTVFLWINGWVGRVPLFDSAMEWLVSDYLVPASLALTLVGIWFVGDEMAVRQRHQIGMLIALISMALASWAVFLINGVYYRPRPFADLDVSLLFYTPTDSSFPSNPAAASFAIATAVWSVNRRVGLAMFLMAGLHGFARVYAGVHYPLDIASGALIGFVIAFFVFKLKNLLKPFLIVGIKMARILCLA